MSGELTITGGVQMRLGMEAKGKGGWTEELLGAQRVLCSESLGFKDSVTGSQLSPFAGKDSVTLFFPIQMNSALTSLRPCIGTGIAQAQQGWASFPFASEGLMGHPEFLWLLSTFQLEIILCACKGRLHGVNLEIVQK